MEVNNILHAKITELEGLLTAEKASNASLNENLDVLGSALRKQSIMRGVLEETLKNSNNHIANLERQLHEERVSENVQAEIHASFSNLQEENDNLRAICAELRAQLIDLGKLRGEIILEKANCAILEEELKLKDRKIEHLKWTVEYFQEAENEEPDDHNLETLQIQNADCEPKNIRFKKFEMKDWNSIYDVHGTIFNSLNLKFDADQGFLWDNTFNCFINEHGTSFEVTIFLEAFEVPRHVFMKVQHHNNKLVPIRGFRIDITVLGGDDTEESIDCLAAAELDPAHPCSFVSQKLSTNRLDFQRLQFPRVILDGCSPIASKNEFRLVARLYASLTDDADFLIQSHVSDRFIILM